jgi:acyl dehydratase
MKSPARLVKAGERCSKNLTLSEDSIKSFAARVEDFNPLHHDAAYAAQTRFGGLIASGTQPIAHFMAILANHFGGDRQPLGLEFSMKLKKAAHLDDTLTMSWEVTEAHWKESLNGDLVTLTGDIVNQCGEIVILGNAKILVMPKPLAEPAGDTRP